MPVLAAGERVTARQMSDFLGVPVRCFGKYVREGWLPQPDSARTWRREDVLALHAWFEAQRVGDKTAVRPSFH